MLQDFPVRLSVTVAEIPVIPAIYHLYKAKSVQNVMNNLRPAMLDEAGRDIFVDEGRTGKKHGRWRVWYIGKS